MEKVCNCCGNERKSLQVVSKKFDDWLSRFDYEHWHFYLCDYCIDDIVKTFKIAPQGFREGFMQLDGEQHQRVFESWKETGVWNECKELTDEELIELKKWGMKYCLFDEELELRGIELES